MKNENSFISHSTALASLFILGNGVIIFPLKGANQYTFLAFLVASVLAVLIYFPLIPLINRVYGEKDKKIKPFKKTLFLIIYSVTALLALRTGATAFWDFSFFASDVLLKDYPNAIAVIIFFITALFFVSCRKEGFLKFCLLAFAVTGAVIAFFFFASLNNFDYENIVILNLPEFKEFYPQIKDYILNPVLSAFLILIYEVCSFKKALPKAIFWGFISGYTLLGLCILNSVLMFGAEFSAGLDFPYASAVSTVTIGRLFTRLDGFSYFVYFSSGIAKTVLCLRLVWEMLKRTDKLLKNN